MGRKIPAANTLTPNFVPRTRDYIGQSQPFLQVLVGISNAIIRNKNNYETGFFT